MLVGVPKEIKDNEYRVGIVPSTARELADSRPPGAGRDGGRIAGAGLLDDGL